MSKSDILPDQSFRIGSVPYLNARPLLEGLDDLSVTELVPSKLFEGYQEGKFDAALVSSIDALSMDHPEMIDGISISSKGDVYSVILVYKGELPSLEKVLLDPASHTSNALLQIMLGDFYGLKPEYVQLSEEQFRVQTSDSPRLLIGDRAIAFRRENAFSDTKILDLGGEWYRSTGLPFVFALWLLRNVFTKKKLLSDRLREAKILGLSRRQEIASRTPDPAFALRYLSDSIRYDLDEEEKRGLELFRSYLQRDSLIRQGDHEARFF